MRDKRAQEPSLPQGFSVTFKKRFWKHTVKYGPIPKHVPEIGECWMWQGATDRKGYGKLMPGVRGFNQINASRASWVLHFGDPGTNDVCHKCDNPTCVNPSHLFVGTRADNMADSARKGRWHLNPRNMARGERQGAHKLTDESVSEIRKLYSSGGITQRQLARAYGVKQSTIWHVIHRHHWTHIA